VSGGLVPDHESAYRVGSLGKKRILVVEEQEIIT
jgi:hypothetical protein